MHTKFCRWNPFGELSVDDRQGYCRTTSWLMLDEVVCKGGEWIASRSCSVESFWYYLIDSDGPSSSANTMSVRVSYCCSKTNVRIMVFHGKLTKRFGWIIHAVKETLGKGHSGKKTIKWRAEGLEQNWLKYFELEPKIYGVQNSKRRIRKKSAVIIKEVILLLEVYKLPLNINYNNMYHY